VELKHGRTTSTALAFAGALALQVACGGGSDRPADLDGATPPGTEAAASAERQVITLTGCLQRGPAPSEFTLASVATAGVIPSGQTGQAAGSEESRAAVAAAASYRLLSMGDEDLAQYDGQRVTVSGRLAPETPEAATPNDNPKGVEVQKDTTSSTVVAEAPTLRGFYVESIRKVDDNCSAG
jgi:hypothetical protein